jgi:hypothetical protein
VKAAWAFRLGTLSSPFIEKGFFGATLAIQSVSWVQKDNPYRWRGSEVT